MSEDKLAARIFDARQVVSMLEDELYIIICERGGIDGNQFKEWSFDGYNSSIEFDGCRPDFRLTAGQQSVLWSIGFQRCWLNHPDGHETYYWDGGNTDGTHHKRGT